MAKTFEQVVPDYEQLTRMKTVREGCAALEAIILALPPCRGRSVAITKLEEVAFWANKGITHEAPAKE